MKTCHMGKIGFGIHMCCWNFTCESHVNHIILFGQCKIAIANVIFSYMLAETPSGEHHIMLYVIQKYVEKSETHETFLPNIRPSSSPQLLANLNFLYLLRLFV